MDSTPTPVNRRAGFRPCLRRQVAGLALGKYLGLVSSLLAQAS